MVDHAHMPGMDHTAKKAEDAKTAGTPQKQQDSKRPDALAQSDKTKSPQRPGTS